MTPKITFSEKRSIGTDMDDVLCGFYSRFLDFLCFKYGLPRIPSGLIHTHHLETLTGLKLSVIYDAIFEFQTQQIEELPLIKGADVAINSLSHKFDIHVVTARDAYFQKGTDAYIRSHFGKGITRTHFTGLENAPLKKSKVCERENILAFVEDNPCNAEAIAQKGIHVILMRRPWNAYIQESEYITPVCDWNEAFGVINEIDTRICCCP